MMKLNVSNVKITPEFLEELQQDLEDAATDYGSELANLSQGDVEDELDSDGTLKVKGSAGSFHRAEAAFQLASEKMRRAIKLFAEQK